MCEYAIEYAKSQGSLGMQFHFVVSNNQRAVNLWHALGFETVRRLPRAFQYPVAGFVDALVMFKAL